MIEDEEKASAQAKAQFGAHEHKYYEYKAQANKVGEYCNKAEKLAKGEMSATNYENMKKLNKNFKEFCKSKIENLHFIENDHLKVYESTTINYTELYNKYGRLIVS